MSYKNISYWYYQDCLTTTEYDKFGLNPIITSTYYYYDDPDNVMLIRSKDFNSDGKEIVEKSYYPNENDYPVLYVDNPPTQKQFLANMEEKMTDKEFLVDIHSILKQEVEYDNLKAWDLIRKELIEKM